MPVSDRIGAGNRGLAATADGAAGNTRADPRDEYRQSTLGSATNSWRACQARHRNRTDQRGEVYGQAERPAIPGLEDVPPQSCRWHRGDGPVRRTDDLISLARWLVNHGHGRRQVLWFGVTEHPTAEWIANQITQACGWKQALAI